MEQYISKSALVAEIEKKRDRIKKGIFSIPLTGRDRTFATFEYEILGNIKDFLYTIEVKEVDLEKELIKWHKQHFKKDGTFIGMSGFYLTNSSQMDIAKHFFELGMTVSNKAQKGE